MTPGFRHVVETQQRIGAILKGRFGVLAVAQLKFHIALAAGKPHLADQHVLEFEEIVARGDAERVRTALRLRGKHHAPRRKTVLEILRSVRVGLARPSTRRNRESARRLPYLRNRHPTHRTRRWACCAAIPYARRKSPPHATHRLSYVPRPHRLPQSVQIPARDQSQQPWHLFLLEIRHAYPMPFPAEDTRIHHPVSSGFFTVSRLTLWTGYVPKRPLR